MHGTSTLSGTGISTGSTTTASWMTSQEITGIHYGGLLTSPKTTSHLTLPTLQDMDMVAVPTDTKKMEPTMKELTGLPCSEMFTKCTTGK